jgi:hypothetical protein
LDFLYFFNGNDFLFDKKTTSYLIKTVSIQDFFLARKCKKTLPSAEFLESGGGQTAQRAIYTFPAPPYIHVCLAYIARFTMIIGP